MSSHKTLLLLLLLSVLNACQSSDPSTQFASEWCTCMTPMVELYDEFGKASSDAPEAINDLLTKLEQVADESDACVTTLQEKYQVDDYNSEEIRGACQKACPQIAQRIEEEWTE